MIYTSIRLFLVHTYTNTYGNTYIHIHIHTSNIDTHEMFPSLFYTIGCVVVDENAKKYTYVYRQTDRDRADGQIGQIDR